MSRIKVALATVVFTASAGLMAPMIAQTELEPAGDCVYAEYRASNGACMGATTRLCQGPADCPRS